MFVASDLLEKVRKIFFTLPHKSTSDILFFLYFTRTKLLYALAALIAEVKLQCVQATVYK